MKLTRYAPLLSVLLATLYLAGCSFHVSDHGTSAYWSPPAVTVDLDIDYWYDGYSSYYRDPGSSLYFYWDNGSRVYLESQWYPNPSWHRHDRDWRYHDPGYRYQYQYMYESYRYRRW